MRSITNGVPTAPAPDPAVHLVDCIAYRHFAVGGKPPASAPPCTRSGQPSLLLAPLRCTRHRGAPLNHGARRRMRSGYDARREEGHEPPQSSALESTRSRRCTNLAAGVLAENETPIEAAMREMKEETGLDLRDPVIVHPGAYVSSGGTSERSCAQWAVGANSEVIAAVAISTSAMIAHSILTDIPSERTAPASPSAIAGP
jgi:hypothetical protein